MKLLLDTHIWIWSVLTPDKLLPAVARRLRSSELYLSPISAWEALILIEKKRIVVEGTAEEWVRKSWTSGPFKEASLTFEVATESRRVHTEHQDPADRFLAATAQVYDLVLVTSDEHLLRSKSIRHLANR